MRYHNTALPHKPRARARVSLKATVAIAGIIGALLGVLSAVVLGTVVPGFIAAGVAGAAIGWYGGGDAR